MSLRFFNEFNIGFENNTLIWEITSHKWGLKILAGWQNFVSVRKLTRWRAPASSVESRPWGQKRPWLVHENKVSESFPKVVRANQQIVAVLHSLLEFFACEHPLFRRALRSKEWEQECVVEVQSELLENVCVCLVQRHQVHKLLFLSVMREHTLTRQNLSHHDACYESEVL
jgi:hypothetical protein